MADGARTLLVPKGPRAQQHPDTEGRNEVAMLRAALFAVPLPPSPTQTRTYPTHTALGRIMRLRGLSVVTVSKIPGGPSARQLGDALAGRRALSTEHRDAIASELGVDRRLLD